MSDVQRMHCRASIVRRHARLASCAILLCGGAVACATAADEEAAAPAVVQARTAVVEAQPFTETIDAIGTVAGRPGHVAVLSATSPSRVARVLVTPGERVRAGQPLVTFDQSPFAAASESADAMLATAQQAYDRAQRLFDQGIVPRRDVEQASAELAHARATASNARREQSLATIRSPIGGVVTSLTATVGASVDAGAPLVTVADPSALDVLLTVTPSQAALVQRGATVALAAGQGGGGESLGSARVADVSAAVDSATRGVTVRAVAPATRRTLRIGETVFGRITVTTRAAAVVVPLDALVPEGEGYRVFVVDAGGFAHARPVKVGGRTDQVAEITDGLRAGERVVTYGAYGVADGARVVPVDGAPSGDGTAPAP